MRYVAKYADLEFTPDPKLKDVASELSRIMARIQQCIERSEHRISTRLHDLSLSRPAQPSKLIRVNETKLKAGKRDAYLDLLRTEVFPAVKASGIKSFAVFHTEYGADGPMVFSSRGLDSWADLDQPNPLLKAMSEDKYRKYLEKAAELVDSRIINIYRYRQDLSYQPAAGASAPTSGN